MTYMHSRRDFLKLSAAATMAAVACVGCADDLVAARKALWPLVQRANVGTAFNLVHWQWVKQTRPLETVLRETLPHLFAITLNGLKGPKGSRQHVRPLDDSDYDLHGFMRLIKKVGYAGPVGLQCYGVGEPPAVHLRRSIKVWQTTTAKM